MTRQRALILEIVNAAYNHPTAEEIYECALEHMPEMVRATVYNNLNALVAAGKIIRLHAADGADHYDRAEHPHGHLICDDCGEISDVELPQNFLNFAHRKWGTSPISLEVTGHRLCEHCVSKQRETGSNV